MANGREFTEVWESDCGPGSSGKLACAHCDIYYSWGNGQSWPREANLNILSDADEDGSDDSWLWRTYPSSVDPVSEEDSDEGNGVGSGDASDDASAASDGRDAGGSPGSQPPGPGSDAAGSDADGSSDSEGLSI